MSVAAHEAVHVQLEDLRRRIAMLSRVSRAVLGLLLAVHSSDAFYLSHLINRRISDMTVTPSPFAVCQSFNPEAFRAQSLSEHESSDDATNVLLDLPSIAATKDIIAEAMNQGLLVRVLGTRVVAFGSRLALKQFVGAISCERVRSAVKWGSQPAPLLL